MTLLQLYILFASTALFTFGGGYAMITILATALVPAMLTSAEMANIVALAQLTPGAVGMNASTYVGFQFHGILGAIVCTGGIVSPALVLATSAAYAKEAVKNNRYFKGCLRVIRPLVIGLIAYVVVFFADSALLTQPIQNLWTAGAEIPNLQWRGIVIFAVVLALDIKFKPSTFWLVGTGALLGILLNL